MKRSILVVLALMFSLIACEPVDHEVELAKKEFANHQRTPVESVDRDDSAARSAFIQFSAKTDDHAGGYLEWSGTKSTVLWTVYQSAYAESTSGGYKHYGPKWTIYAKSANGRYFFVALDIEYNRFSEVAEMTSKQIYQRAAYYGKPDLIPLPPPPTNDA